MSMFAFGIQLFVSWPNVCTKNNRKWLLDLCCTCCDWRQYVNKIKTEMLKPSCRSVYMTRTSGLYPNGTEIARNDPQKPQVS